MGVYLNGRSLSRPYLNSKPLNAYLNGKQLWKKKTSSDPIEIENVWESSNGFMSLASDSTVPCTEPYTNSWNYYGYTVNCNGTITYWTPAEYTWGNSWKTFTTGFFVTQNMKLGKYRLTLHYVSGSIIGPDKKAYIYFDKDRSHSQIIGLPDPPKLPVADGETATYDFEWTQSHKDFWNSDESKGVQKHIYLRFTNEEGQISSGLFEWNDWTFLPTLEYLGPLD